MWKLNQQLQMEALADRGRSKRMTEIGMIPLLSGFAAAGQGSL